MKHLKPFEGIEEDIVASVARAKAKLRKGEELSNSQDDEGPYDFSPRRGSLMIIKDNTWELYYFHEAYREVITFLENNKIDTNLSITNIRYYVNSITTDTTNKAQYKNQLNGTLNNEQKVLINLILSKYDRLFDIFWNISWRNQELSFSIDQLFTQIFNFNDDKGIPDIINLNNMNFYYNGFVLNLITKKWTPSKNIPDTDFNNDKEIIDIFKNYDFQKEYLKNDPSLILNIPGLLLNDKIRLEYEYIFQSKKYNL
jgi:hypothetical protein